MSAGTGLSAQDGSSVRWTGQVGPAVTWPATPEDWPAVVAVGAVVDVAAFAAVVLVVASVCAAVVLAVVDALVAVGAVDVVVVDRRAACTVRSLEPHPASTRPASAVTMTVSRIAGCPSTACPGRPGRPSGARGRAHR